MPIAALCLSLIAGCAAVPDAGGQEAGRKGLLSSAAEQATTPRIAPPLERVALAGGDVRIAPPEGYCIDSKSRRGSAERGFAAIAACRVLTAGRVGAYVEPVLMTVTAGPRGGVADLPTPEALAKAAQAPLIAGSRTEDTTLAHLARGGAATLPGGDRRHWRAIFVVNERLVGLALYAPANNPMAGAEGAELLLRLKARIVAESTAPTEQAPRKPGGAGLMALLKRR